VHSFAPLLELNTEVFVSTATEGNINGDRIVYDVTTQYPNHSRPHRSSNPSRRNRRLAKVSLDEKNRIVPKPMYSAQRQSGRARDQFWDRLAPVAFCLFMACLIALLVLTYSSIPIV
jgi:hypothetical protein